MKTLQLLVLMLISSTAFGQQKIIYNKTATGLEYKIYSGGGKIKPKTGDLIKTILVYTTAKDSVIYDSRISRPENIFELLAPTYKGSLEEGMLLMAVGDSAVFRVPADSIYTKTFKTKRPPFVKKGSKLIFKIKLLGIKSSDANRSPEELVKELEELRVKEPQLLADFIELNNITVPPTAIGLYYIEKEAGDGPLLDFGNKVKIKYNCTTLDGKVIDTQLTDGVEIDLGTSKITKGMEEGLRLMKVGTKGTLIIPSDLAFGQRKIGTVMPYTTLIYDIEIIEVR